MKVVLFVEGGGDSHALRVECRRGFRTFLERAGLSGRMPRIVACGGRGMAYNDFCHAVQQGDCALLLVDSEAAVVDGHGPWEHLHLRDGWSAPDGSEDAQCHLMVQVTESWFLADRPALEQFFGHGFREASLPANPDLERIPKQDVMRGLREATTQSRKGGYSKGRHCFKLLALIHPDRVGGKAPWAKRFLAAIADFCQ